MTDDGILINWNMDFDDDYIVEVQQKTKIGMQEGYLCSRCNDFYPYAEINQNNNTFKCWSCRNGLGISI